MHIQTVEQLLGVDRIRFRYLRNVGDRIRKEIRLKAKRLAEYRPDLLPGGDESQGEVGRASLDRLGELLLPRRPAGDDTNEDRALEVYLGMDGTTVWPNPGDVARTCGFPRSVIATALEQARDRWHRARELNELRTDIADLLQTMGGVATADELGTLLLASRGTIEADRSDRVRLARAVLRAAVELEAAVGGTRFIADASVAPVLIAISAELADFARQLGQVADGMAVFDPLPNSAAVQDALSSVTAPDVAVRPVVPRLLRLAASASTNAALSARMELYPRGFPPIDALRLSLGALAGPQRLTVEDVIKRVRSRFPEAAPLPGRPELDALLDQAGAERVWREDGLGSAYVAKQGSDTFPSSLEILRHATHQSAVCATPEVLSARGLEEQLAHAARTGAFLALTVEPLHATRAEAEILGRYPRIRISLERLMLRALHDEAIARGARWPVVVAADAAEPDSKDSSRLVGLAAKAADVMRRQVLALNEPALLVNPGLLARYKLMEVLTEMAQASGTRSGPPSLWLLVPQPDPGMPHIDGVTLPVISAANWARLTDTWLANAHRAGTRPVGRISAGL